MFKTRLKTTALLLSCFFLAATAQKKAMTLVADNDCGVADKQAFLVKGNDYTMPEGIKGSMEARTCNFGSKIIYAFDKMDIHADYRLEVTYLADHLREQHIIVDGNELQRVTLQPGKEQHYTIQLPRKAYAYGQMVLIFELYGQGDNAIVSDLKLYSSNSKRPVPFDGESKRALENISTFSVDTNIDVESVLPVYIPKPSKTLSVANPVMSLCGQWKFCAKPGKDFPKENTGEKWADIRVPGEWAMQGFKVDSCAFAGYKKQFRLPADWKNNRVRLRFDGVHSEYYVFINGKKAGYHLGGMTPYELDITPFLKEGANELALAVRSESLADMLGSLTQYAAHQMGGILRKVSLMAVPENHLSDLRIATTLTNGMKDAKLDAQISVANASSKAVKDLSLRLTVEGYDAINTKHIQEIKAGKSCTETISAFFASPQLWSNENPKRYTLRVDLLQNGKVIETVEKKIGFREVKVAGNLLLVNGKVVKLRGVCRHEMHPTEGRAVPYEWELKDILTYRDANCNFIRTSHYPPCEEMLDLCDSIGMFVECEAPVCWVGHHANENWQRLNYRDEKYLPYILQANMENIQFNRNHPSILFWSMANESYWCKTFAQVQEYVTRADTTRPHTFHDQAYGGFNNQGSTSPIANIHYPGPGGYKAVENFDRPITYGEFCHLNCYNRTELETDPGVRCDWGVLALGPAWENMRKTPSVLGGSIWSGIDDIFQLADGRAVGYGGWGPIDGWRRPKPEYWDMKNVYSPVRVLTDSLSPAKTLSIEVENRYTFTDLNKVEISYRYGKETGSTHISAAPGEKTRFAINVSRPMEANSLYLSFTDPRGFVVNECLIPVGAQTQQQISMPAEAKTSLKKTKELFIITGKNVTYTVNRSNGQLTAKDKSGNELITNGPTLMVLPLVGGGCYPNHNANTPLMNDCCKNWEATATTAVKNGKNVTVQVTGTYKEMKGEYNLTFNTNGVLTVDYRFQALSDINPRQWGLVFDAPSTMNTTFWNREGQWSVYPADHIARPVGTAKALYADFDKEASPRKQPTWTWSHDANRMGSNDFRATRRNIFFAGLEDATGRTITAVGNGKQHWRSWLEDNHTRFIVADFTTAGDEMFLGGFYAPTRRPLKKGDIIEGHITILLSHQSKLSK